MRMYKESSLTPSLIVFIVVIFLIGGFIYMKSAGSVSPPLSASSPTSSNAQLERTAHILSSLSLDTSLFSDPRFTALSDITVPIASESVGRPNPFAPF